MSAALPVVRHPGGGAKVLKIATFIGIWQNSRAHISHDRERKSCPSGDFSPSQLLSRLRSVLGREITFVSLRLIFLFHSPRVFVIL
jgi:hypothetical protein